MLVGPGKFLLQVLLLAASHVCAQAALAVAHTLGWFPEDQLASLFMTWLGELHIEAVRWVMLLLLTVFVWGVADYFLYRRHAIRTVARSSPREDKHTSNHLPSNVPASLLKDGWILNFNPTIPTGRKPISFLSDGSIGEGNNKNEARWKMVNGMLEIFRPNNDLQNRFRYDAQGEKFICTNDTDAKGYKNQFIFRDRAV